MAVQNLNIQDSLVNQGLLSQNLPLAIVDMTGNYFKFSQFDELVMRSNRDLGPQWTPVKSLKKESLFQNKDYSTGTVKQAPTVVGNNVTIVFNQASEDAFIEGMVISNSNTNIKAQVISHAPGTVTVVPVEGTTINQLMTAWTTGQVLVSRYDASPLRTSAGKESLTYTPEYGYNVFGTVRMSQAWSAVDNLVTKPFQFDNQNRFRLYNDSQRMQRFFKDLFTRFRYARRAVDETRDGKKYNEMGGIDWAIETRGGEMLSLSGPLTQDNFENWAGLVWDKRPARTEPMVLLGGRNGLNKIRQFYTGNITASGILNTFGGADVSGLNLQKVSVNGMDFVLIEDYYLNDRQYFPQLSSIAGMQQQSIKSNDVYLLDMEPLMGSLGSMIPSCQMYCFGEKPFTVGYIKGMAELDANMLTDSSLESMMMTTGVPLATAVDECSWHVIGRVGLDFLGARYSGKLSFIN